MILSAGRECGATADQIHVEWKAGVIVVTVRGDVYVADNEIDSEEEDEEFDEDEQEYDGVDDEEYDDDKEYDNEDTTKEVEEEDDELEEIVSEDDGVSGDEVNSEEDMGPVEEADQSRGIDIAALARAINAALDDEGVGFAIAESHEIEVTTPGASDELQGPVMFKAYKGFDVLATFIDPKKKTQKTIEGKLHERNNEFTVINIKGRLKNIKNQMLVSVKLPKPKKEKGAR
jgi:ribosome maturation factor RimP